MTRRSGEETKQLLLTTAMEMLLARGVQAGVGHIRLQDVVRRARLTTGAAYRLWSDQDDFHRDLAVAVARWRDKRPVADLQPFVTDPQLRSCPLEEVIRLAAAAHVRAVSGDDTRSSRLFLIALALRTSARSWEDLAVASVERHWESIADFANLYGVLMRAHGFTMRPPLTVEDFTVAMAALGEGFAVQGAEGVPHRCYDPEASAELDDPNALSLPGGQWTLFALAVRALVEGFMVKESAGATAPARSGQSIPAPA